MVSRLVRGLAWGSVVLLAGCEQQRPPLGEPICIGWKATVGALLEERCVDCHSATASNGDVVLDDYGAALASTRPRDGTAPMLAVFDLDSTHRALSAARPTLERWIVDCDAAFLVSDIHGAGILDPASAGFHATILRTSGYDFENCQRCHGEDYDGGGAEASCLTCHPRSPTDCSTCHGEENRSGAHAAHETAGPLERPSPCESCHVVPDDALDPGHLRLARGQIDPPPAEVTFGGASLWGAPTFEQPTASGDPTYDASTQTCVNVYCHGGPLADPAASLLTPSWTSTESLDCSSCHGAPPAEHPGDRCGDCHNAVSSGPTTVTRFDAHIDGRLQLAATEDCDGCHGGDRSTDGAPAPDLDGRTTPMAIGVGAHAGHLQPRLGLGAAVACGECHIVPDRVIAPGHIDSDRPAEVFIVGAGDLARADGATPTWDRTSATCASTYCHGGGDRLGDDRSEGRVEDVSWTSGSAGQVYCGSCHGIPPTTPPHLETTTFSDCVRCHSQTVNAGAGIIFDGETTMHMNGVVDVDDGDGP